MILRRKELFVSLSYSCGQSFRLRLLTTTFLQAAPPTHIRGSNRIHIAWPPFIFRTFSLHSLTFTVPKFGSTQSKTSNNHRTHPVICTRSALIFCAARIGRPRAGNQPRRSIAATKAPSEASCDIYVAPQRSRSDFCIALQERRDPTVAQIPRHALLHQVIGRVLQSSHPKSSRSHPHGRRAGINAASRSGAEPDLAHGTANLITSSYQGRSHI